MARAHREKIGRIFETITIHPYSMTGLSRNSIIFTEA